MSTVFLSASIPLPHRNPVYYRTADIVAIRDCIRALVNAVIPPGEIVFGGHPAITPLISLLAKNISEDAVARITIYQSMYFEKQFTPDTFEFENLKLVPAFPGDLSGSIRRMRDAMIGGRDFDAGVFVGGMEGVEDEYELFRKFHPAKPAYPIASTGAAAERLFRRFCPDRDELKSNLLYLSLFRRLLNVSE